LQDEKYPFCFSFKFTSFFRFSLAFKSFFLVFINFMTKFNPDNQNGRAGAKLL